MPGRWWLKSITALGVFIFFLVGYTICTTSLHAFQGSDIISPRNSHDRVAAAAGPDSAAVNSMTAVTGSKPWVVILCRYSDYTDFTPFSKERAEEIMGSAYPGMDHYWREVSYGKINLEGSVVVGWYDLPHPQDYYYYDVDGDGHNYHTDTQRIVDDATNAADGDVYFPDFAGVIFVMNYAVWPCGGDWEIDKDGVRRPYGCVFINSANFEYYANLAHEMGHGFGLPHSSGPYGMIYDSLWDVMSCSFDYMKEQPYIPTHTIAYHKDLLGWIDPGRKLVVTPGTSQTISIERLAQPISSTDYLLVVIPIPGTERFYTLETRKFAGYDSSLPGEGVIIHAVDTSRDPPAHVVDIDNNGNVNDEGARWNPGEVFTDDAHGITVSVNAETYSGFEVTVAVDSYDTESPTAAAATGVATTGFTANWTAPSGTATITGYRLDVSTSPGFASFVTGYNDLPVSGTSAAVMGLSSNCTYYYRTRAINSGGTSSNSNTVSVTTIANAPTATAATDVTSTGFTANWTPPSGAVVVTGYRLDVSTSSGFNSFVDGYHDLFVSGVRQPVSGLSPGTTYYFRVRAVNAGGTSSNSNTITAVPSWITITSPGDSTSWMAGSKQAISWTYGGTPGSKVKIELLKAGNLSATLASSVAVGKGQSGSYAWTLKSTLDKGDDYQVRVTSTTNSSYTGTSSYFTVEGPTIRLNPLGQSFPAGGKLPISWTYTGSPGNVKIQLLQGGLPITTIKSSTSAGKNSAGSYTWTIPKTQSTGAYQVRVTAVASGECTSTSNTFNIAGPTITLNSPNGSVSFTAGGKLPIFWSYTGSPGNVKIELLKGGSPIKTIKSSTSAGKNTAGSYTWTIPKTITAGSDYQVRVTATADSSCGDTSPDFSIGSVQASAGPDQHAKASTLVNLSGLNSTGITDTSSAYHWAQTLGPPVEISDPNAPETIFQAPEINTGAASLGFQLTITNSEGVKSEDSCIINVSDTQTPPVAEAGPNREVSVAQIVELDGSKSTASASNPIASCSWKQLSGTSVVLTDPSAVQTTFIAPGASATGQSLVFELTVTDQAGLRARDTCVVSIISQNRPPIADAGPSQTILPGARVVLNGTRSYDEDGAIMFYRWKQLSGKPVTLSDPTAATPSFKAPLSETGCEENTLVFQLIVTDSMGLEGSSKTTIHVKQ